MPMTPGPYEVGVHDDTGAIGIVAPGCAIAHVLKSPGLEIPIPRETALANAHLLAASWEMWQALQMVNAFYSEGVDEEDPTERQVMAAVRAAIAKAAPTGASPNP